MLFSSRVSRDTAATVQRVDGAASEINMKFNCMTNDPPSPPLALIDSRLAESSSRRSV